MSGLEASLVLIGVFVGVIALMVGGGVAALLLLDRTQTRGGSLRWLAHH